MILDDILVKFEIPTLTEAEKAGLNRAWHRLKPWVDAVRGLKRLKKRHTIATLSNGNVALLNNMAKHAGLPWDLILSAEIFHHYKPDPDASIGQRTFSDCSPGGRDGGGATRTISPRHSNDLKTALVLRPLGFGKGRHPILRAPT